MKNILKLILCSYLLLSSCSKEVLLNSEVRALNKYGYFPLHIGNEWDYASGLKIRIDSKETVDGIEYFRFLRSYNTSVDTIYYRKKNYKVFERKSNKSEILKFNLKARKNSTWKYTETPNSKFQYSVYFQDKYAKVETENYEFRNCYKFYYDIPNLADDEHLIYLAKGIGLVKKKFYGFGIELVLTRAKINGSEITF